MFTEAYLSWSPLLIAQAEGYFRDEGVAVEFVTGLRSEEATVGVVTGAIDVRPGPVSTGLLSAIVQGAHVRIVSGLGYLARDGCAYFGIALRHGVDGERPGSVKRMRASQDGASRFLVSRMLASRHLQLSDIETVRLPEPEAVAALQTGSLDAAALSEPGLSRLVRAGSLWMSAQQAVPDFQWGVITFGDRLLTRDRDVGLRFLRAYLRGVAQYREGKTPRNVSVIAKEAEREEEETRTACWPAFQDGLAVNWSSVDEFQSWAVAEHLMDRVLSKDDVWDRSFAEAIGAAHAPGRIP